MLPANHPALAESFGGLARLRSAQGNFAEAESFLRQELSIEEAVYGPASREIVGTLKSLANACDREEKTADASAVRERIKQIEAQPTSTK